MESFEFTEDYTASNIPFLCTAVDPQYSGLKFATSVQRSTAHVAILKCLKESPFQSSTTEGNDGKASLASEAPTQKKTVLEVLLGDISIKSSVLTPVGKLESFTKEVEGFDTNPLVWEKANHGRYPHLSKLTKWLYVFQQHWFHPKESSLCLKQSPVQSKTTLARNVDMLIFLSENFPRL